MKRISEEEVRLIYIDILSQVHEFCLQHDINYSLAYGTLLGAVRHKGYIPWDDDIDIMMLRPDYERFIEEFNNKGKSRYSVVSYKSDTNFHYPFAKVVDNSTINDELGYCMYGIGIDLFPIDKIPENKNKAKRYQNIQYIYWMMYQLKPVKWNKNRDFFKNLIAMISKSFLYFIPYSFLNKQMRNRSLRYAYLENDYNLGCLNGPYCKKECMPKEIFTHMRLMPFENSEFFGLEKYDSYLKHCYGDYMQLPPVEKKVSHHDFIAYWK